MPNDLLTSYLYSIC